MRAAFYALHYGSEYLAWSIRSIQDAVDEIHVLYAPEPSFGNRSGLRCPDTEDQLHAEANRFLNKPLHWHRGCWPDEGKHRDAIFPILRARGAQTMLVVDADEIWSPSSARATLELVERHNCAGRWMVHFHNFWRSFNWTVNDHFMPVRVVDLRHPLSVDAYIAAEKQSEPVYHFGYAQSLLTMRYKWSCHGHQAELRLGWMNKFEQWKPDVATEDLHPCVDNLWDKAHRTGSEVTRRLEEILHDHPYLGVECIA